MTFAPIRVAASSIVRVRRRDLLLEILLGIEAAIDGEPRGPGHDVEVRAAARRSTDDQHRAARLLALQRVVGAAREQLVGEIGERLGDLDHLREGIDAEMRLPHVRGSPLDRDAQRDRAAARVPDDAAGRLGGEHRDRAGVDHPALAQVAGADDTAGLLVAHEVQDDPAVAEQAESARRGGAVEHAHEPALHVGGTAADDPAVGPPGPELLTRLRRDDVEVPVEVDRPRARSGAAADDARLLEAGARRQLDQLGREIQREHRVAQQSPALAEPAARRVLAVDRNERLAPARPSPRRATRATRARHSRASLPSSPTPSNGG